MQKRSLKILSILHSICRCAYVYVLYRSVSSLSEILNILRTQQQQQPDGVGGVNGMDVNDRGQRGGGRAEVGDGRADFMELMMKMSISVNQIAGKVDRQTMMLQQQAAELRALKHPHPNSPANNTTAVKFTARALEMEGEAGGTEALSLSPTRATQPRTKSVEVAARGQSAGGLGSGGGRGNRIGKGGGVGVIAVGGKDSKQRMRKASLSNIDSIVVGPGESGLACIYMYVSFL